MDYLTLCVNHIYLLYGIFGEHSVVLDLRRIAHPSRQYKHHGTGKLTGEPVTSPICSHQINFVTLYLERGLSRDIEDRLGWYPKPSEDPSKSYVHFNQLARVRC